MWQLWVVVLSLCLCKIAKHLPGSLVAGKDKSKDRTCKNCEKFDAGENFLLLRAKVVDIWRLAAKAGWS